MMKLCEGFAYILTTMRPECDRLGGWNVHISVTGKKILKISQNFLFKAKTSKNMKS